MADRHRTGTCLHCGRTGVKIPARGLCWRCYKMTVGSTTRITPTARAYPLEMENRKGWTKREVDTLLHCIARKCGLAEVARTLGRSYRSVQCQVTRLKRLGRLEGAWGTLRVVPPSSQENGVGNR
jgi:hypothetical protein